MSVKVVNLSVSGDTPTVNSEDLVLYSVTVRHVPLTAMLSPRFIPWRTVLPLILILKLEPLVCESPMCLISPISSTIPVNID